MRFIDPEPKLRDAARKKRGREGEDRAAALLEQGGYRVVERNYISRFGELDLVMEQGELLVFVEVRSRASDWFSSPLHTVDRAKQRKVVLSAMEWITRNRVAERPIRFDVISIAGGQLEHIENAFDAGR